MWQCCLRVTCIDLDLISAEILQGEALLRPNQKQLEYVVLIFQRGLCHWNVFFHYLEGFWLRQFQVLRILRGIICFIRLILKQIRLLLLAFQSNGGEIYSCVRIKKRRRCEGEGLLNTHSAVCEHSAAEIDVKDRPELFSLLSLFKWLYWEDSKSCLWATQNVFQVTERFRAPTANRRTHGL